MRFVRLVAASLILSLLPLTAFAQSTSANPSLSALLAEITALEQQMSALSTSTSVSTSAGTNVQQPTTAGSCPILGRTLSLGASGSDVVSLQTFLSAKGFLQTSATGYFGTLTQAAVSEWQEQNGVVAGGDANSTGLGVVGPKTRAAMASACGTGQTSAQGSTKAQCLPVSPPQTDCPNNWQPVLDAAGCAMYYQCSIALPGTGTTASSPSSTSSAPTSCPVVQKPICSGAVTPFQTNANGCVMSYQCVI